ncbi:MAG: ABC transporter ATP-binding protein [Betaproteobacteria bacterium]|nr:ABC transporter ATP-binding protein [Betaproteobacteria bacterium]
MELVINGLSKTYPNGVQALKNVTLTIPTGMFGLLGPNGAGKSTLMRTLATLQDADAGSVRLGDIDVLKDKDAVRRQLGYLPQEFGVYPKVSAMDMLNHLAELKGLSNKKERMEVVSGLLKQTNLHDVRDKALGGFSGGMRQRFGIAQALLGNPKLIIVDEPTAGLDPEERVRFHNLLAEIGEQVIVVLSTHIVSDVSDLCPNMAIINKGEVLLTGKPAELTRALEGRLWATSVPRAELAAAKQRYPVISTRLISGKTRIHVIGNRQPDSAFLPVAPELEDTYFAAIGGFLGDQTAQPTESTESNEPAESAESALA